MLKLVQKLKDAKIKTKPTADDDDKKPEPELFPTDACKRNFMNEKNSNKSKN